MSDQTLKSRITNAMKDAMRAKEKERLGVIRLMLAAIQSRELEARASLEDDGVLSVLGRMIKQGRDSIQQFDSAGRQDLADKERAEISVIQEFMPAVLEESEIDQLIEEAITKTGASSVREMGKVMAFLKTKLQERADMGSVGGKVKSRLSQ